MGYEVRVEKIGEARPLAVVKLVARPEEFSRVVPKYCGVVWNALKAQQVKGAGRHIAVYLDDRVNLEVGVEMKAPYDGDGEVVGSSIPVGWWRRRFILGRIRNCVRRTRRYMSGVDEMDMSWRGRSGRFMGIGWRSGITIRRRFRRMCFMC